MDREAWWATVSKSGTRLSDWAHTHTHTHTHTRYIGVLRAVLAAPLCRDTDSPPAEATHACCPHRRAPPVIPEAGSEPGVKGLPVSYHLIPRSPQVRSRAQTGREPRPRPGSRPRAELGGEPPARPGSGAPLFSPELGCQLTVLLAFQGKSDPPGWKQRLSK